MSLSKTTYLNRNGLYYTNISDTDFPYTNISGFGVTAIESEVKATEIWTKIAEKSLNTNPVYVLEKERIHEIHNDIYPPFLNALKGNPTDVQHEWLDDAQKVTWFNKLKARLFVWFHSRVHKN